MQWFKNLKLSSKFMLPVTLSGSLILLGVLAGFYVIKANNTRLAGINMDQLHGLVNQFKMNVRVGRAAASREAVPRGGEGRAPFGKRPGMPGP